MEKCNTNKMTIKFLSGDKYIPDKNNVMERYNVDYT